MESLIVNKPFSIFSFNFLRAYLITMRPYLLFVSGITGIAGMSFIPELSISKTILIITASFLSYGFGQALTDCFQTDTDSISSPYRPLTQGLISKRQVLTISILGLLFCVSVFSIYNPMNLLLGIISGIGLATYTYFKKKFWAGPFYNAWIVGVLFLMAYLCGANFSDFSGNPKITFALITVFFGYANFVLVGYFKDIEADRKTSYKTLPVVFGRRTASVVSNVFGLITIIASILVFVNSKLSSIVITNISFAFLFLFSGILVMMLCQIFVHQIRNDDESSKAINLSVHAYILLLASVAVLNNPDWVFTMILFYALFNLTILLRPSKTQI